MSNYSVNEDALLRQLNDEKAVQMVPVIVYMSVLMLVGIVGNLMVCYFYGYKTKLTSNTIFIIGMAAFDLVTCSITIPLEIYELRYFYMFFNAGACKVMRFITHFASVCSATILVAIAIDRYRRICRTSIQQYSLRSAVRALAVSVGIAVFLAWPVLILYTTVSVVVQNDHNITLYGSDCTTARHSSIQVFQWIFNGIYLLLFVFAVVMLCVLYYRVVKVLVKHSRTQRRYSRPITADLTSTQHDSNGTESSFTVDDNKHEQSDDTGRNSNTFNDLKYSFEINESEHSGVNNDLQKEYVNTYNNRDQNDATNPRNQEEVVRRLKSNADKLVPHLKSNNENTDSIDQKTIKYTTVMISITVTYIISFLPYLILAIWRLFIRVYEVGVLSDTGLVFFQIGLRSYMLNSAINPFLYGFFNSKFRTFFYRLFFPCCNHETVETSTTSS